MTARLGSKYRYFGKLVLVPFRYFSIDIYRNIDIFDNTSTVMEALHPRAPQCRLLTAPSVCALGWVKRTHFTAVILRIIVYVTNKTHLSLIIIMQRSTACSAYS